VSGCYVARLVADEVPGLAQRTPFTLNGFYPAMREQFVEEGAKVRVWALKDQIKMFCFLSLIYCFSIAFINSGIRAQCNSPRRAHVGQISSD